MKEKTKRIETAASMAIYRASMTTVLFSNKRCKTAADEQADSVIVQVLQLYMYSGMFVTVNCHGCDGGGGGRHF